MLSRGVALRTRQHAPALPRTALKASISCLHSSQVPIASEKAFTPARPANPTRRVVVDGDSWKPKTAAEIALFQTKHMEAMPPSSFFGDGVYQLLPDLPELVPENEFGNVCHKEFGFIGRHAIMAREPLPELMAAATNAGKADQTDPTKPIMIDGEKGIGKSAVLLHLVHWARSNGWIVMYAPNSRNWVEMERAVHEGTGTAALFAESQVYPDMFSQPYGAQRILNSVMSVHGEALKTLAQKRTYEHDSYVRVGEVTLAEQSKQDQDKDLGQQQRVVPDKSIYDIVAAGIKSMRVAGDAVHDLRLELSLVTEYPVLIAADEYNCLHWPNCFALEGEPIHQDKMQLATSFRFMDDKGVARPEMVLKRGLQVVATQRKKVYPCSIKNRKKKNQRPVDECGPFTPRGILRHYPTDESAFTYVTVPAYTSDELQSAVYMYQTLADVVAIEPEGQGKDGRTKDKDVKEGDEIDSATLPRFKERKMRPGVKYFSLIRIATGGVPGKVYKEVCKPFGVVTVDWLENMDFGV